MERGTRDTDGIRHSAKAAWRAPALLQKEIEAERQPAAATAPPVGLRLTEEAHESEPRLVKAYIRYLNTPAPELPPKLPDEGHLSYLLRVFAEDEE